MTVQSLTSTRGTVNADEFPTRRPGGLVLVTGATGIVGSHIALQLCRAGYEVRATSRSQARADAWNAKWPQAQVTWTIIPDQATPHVYDDAAKGCVGLFHAAGPFNYFHENAEAMIQPTTEGILNILRAAVQVPTVRRVVHINSLAAIHLHDPTITNGVGNVYDETCWNHLDYETATTTKNHDRQYAYTFAKKHCELLANEFMQDNKPHFDLVTLCPSTNYGRILQSVNTLDELDTASRRLHNYILKAKTEMPQNPYPNFTAAKDVAKAALNGFLYPVAGGKRYQLTSGDYSYAHIFSIIKRNFPDQAHRFPEIANDGLPLAPRFTVDTSLATRDLAMRWTPLEEAIVEEVTDLFALEKKLGMIF